MEPTIALPSVTVIIAAYNEQSRLEVTVSSILDSGFPCELVVVDDGSTDKTPEILRKFESAIRTVTHPTNRGKGAAVASGLRVASGEIVVFCDAHVLGLTQYHLLSLVLPLVYGSARAVLGVDTPEGVSFSLMRPVSPLTILTGQRAYYKSDLMPLLSEMQDLGYGVETYLFSKFPREKTAVVLLPGLVHLVKRDTSSAVAASAAYLREVIEILDTLAKISDIMPRESRELNRIRQEVSSLLSRYMGTSQSERAN